MTSRDGSTANLSYDAANKLSTTSAFSYDKDGDMTSSSPSGASYNWDDRGNMVSRSVSGQASYVYGYNAMGLRVHSVITPNAQPTVNTFYIYDGGKLLGEVSSAGTVNVVYTWGSDGLISECLQPVTTAKSLFYAFGPQGETRQLTSNAWAVVDSYTYTAWGQALASTGSDANPFQYGGKYGYYTEYGGAVLCGHRWYDTGTLRWLSRDPIGYEGGVNLYVYTGNNPVNGSDPSGFDPQSDPDQCGLPDSGDLGMKSIHPGMQAGTAQSKTAHRMTSSLVSVLISAVVGVINPEGKGLEAVADAFAAARAARLARSGSGV